MENRVKEVIASILMVDILEVKDESSPETIESWDSLKQMNVIIGLEEEFDIMFTDEQVIDMLNVKLIINIVKELI